MCLPRVLPDALQLLQGRLGGASWGIMHGVVLHGAFTGRQDPLVGLKLEEGPRRHGAGAVLDIHEVCHLLCSPEENISGLRVGWINKSPSQCWELLPSYHREIPSVLLRTLLPMEKSFPTS